MKHLLKSNLFKAYAIIKHPLPLWRLFNSEGIKLFKKNIPTLNDVQKGILADLNDTGIATTTLDELFPGENVLSIYQKYIQNRKDQKEVNHKKKYLIDYFDECPELGLENPTMKYALDSRILDVVNSYMEMYTQMLGVYVQETIPDNSERRNSQNWHRDPQEPKICKVFTYFNDIDVDAGPFVYVKNSVPGKKYGHLFPQKMPFGSYPDIETVKKKIPEEEYTPMIGKAGTVVFCDTIGFHYGGLSRKSPRIMSTFVYGAKTYRDNQMYYYSQNFKDRLKTMSKAAQYAIREKWGNKP